MAAGHRAAISSVRHDAKKTSRIARGALLSARCASTHLRGAAACCAQHRGTKRVALVVGVQDVVDRRRDSDQLVHRLFLHFFALHLCCAMLALRYQNKNGLIKQYLFKTGNERDDNGDGQSLSTTYRTVSSEV